MRDVPPPEVMRAIVELYQLTFTPVPFTSKEQLVRYVSKDGTGLGPWFDELWDEYEERDSVLAHDNEGNVYRFIRTLTLYVVRDRPIDGVANEYVRETLDETVEWPDGRLEKRRFNNTLSEKIRWKEGGVWLPLFRYYRKHVRRAAREELGIALTRKFLEMPWLQRIWPSMSYVKTKAATPGPDSTLDIKRNDKNRPGVVTYNRLYNYFLKLHKQFWRAEYRESKYDQTGNLKKTLVHRWIATSSKASLVAPTRHGAT